MHDTSLLHFIQKVRSWINWDNSDSDSAFRGFEMTDNNFAMCCHCERNVLKSYLKHHCQSCGRLFCGNCIQSLGGIASNPPNEILNNKSCKLCYELGPPNKSGRRCSGKVYPSADSPRKSPEPPSPSFSGEKFGGLSPHVLTRSSDASLCRSDEDDGENSTSHFLSASNEYFRDASDVDSSSFSARHEFYSYMSVGSSPSDSPSSRYVQLEQAVLEKPADDLSICQHKSENLQQPLDFESNGLIWFPPPPHDVNDDMENNLLTYDDDEDDEVGDYHAASIDAMFLAKEKQQLDQKGRAEIETHFRALVLQLLQGQGVINATKDNCAENWLDIVIAIAWQTARFIKPDTSRGGSMDPCDYLKVKCVASGSPGESKLIKGVVCTKNIKHKRMMSQYKNARLLLLGGSLEYQRLPNQLASFETLLQQENDHLKTIVSKIEALRPNVLLVEKSVSSFALEHLLAKDISLVLNVKRPLMERIARCTGATITPSIDHISTTRLGHCELFHLERVSEEHEMVNQLNKKPSKTLMFFEGCPRRLGCTVVLRGSNREELKKVKNVVQYAVFAAYHLSLETSFLADEGASLPKLAPKSSCFIQEKTTLDNAISKIPDSLYREEINLSSLDIGSADLTLELGLQESLSELGDYVVSLPDEFIYRKALSEACDQNLALHENHTLTESGEIVEDSNECYSTIDSQQSILVSFSSHCMVNGTVCERSRPLRVKFYGPSDKPLGRYLRDDLFDQSYQCRSCKESAEAHVICYTHQHANLTINVRKLPSVKLPGEQDGKIWMWHRCLRCAHTEGVPPATPRVVMSDAAWGLSFGKFLELSFSTHASGNRVATCGHSLQRDCLRFYGFGSMVAFFRYSPINILSVCLPPSILEFGGPGENSWIRREAYELWSKVEALYAEISGVLEEFKTKSLSSVDELSDASELHNHVLELNDMLYKEKDYYKDLLELSNKEIPEHDQAAPLDILEINHLRHSLLIGSHVWNKRLHLLDSLLKKNSSPKAPNDVASLLGLKDCDTFPKDSNQDLVHKDNMSHYPKLHECPTESLPSNNIEPNSSPLDPDLQQDEENDVNITSLERAPSAASILSDKIDTAWSGTDVADISETFSSRQTDQKDGPSFRRLMGPTRVYSFDSAQRLQERIKKGLPPSSLYLSTLRSFHASGDYRHMVRDPVTNVRSKIEAQKSNLSSSFISSASLLPEGARLMVLQIGLNDIVLAVYEKEPTSIISYALSSKEYGDWVADKLSVPESSGSNSGLHRRVNSVASDLSTWRSFGSTDFDYMNYGSYTSADAASSTAGLLFADHKGSSHLQISFEDESSNASSGKVKFSVTCYFAKEFDALRRRCCPNEVDFVRSLSRCRRWSAQGGKSNVYFAKSFDERFIIKQVTKTELESFEEFAPEYFKYLTDALSSGSPTCLAKILGIYQVTVKHMKGGKEVKMDLMVMENLFFRRSISKVYDLKGSTRGRYNADTKGANKVLLDTNLLETLRTDPIFLGSKAKRRLERAVWNDTSFLACVDVMDYSLLVGVDEERKELVVGIIDFMRQYTWDKYLETWVKESGILGGRGPKNASPTIISPIQYKKRFRKAMTTYFLTVPDQWPS